MKNNSVITVVEAVNSHVEISELLKEEHERLGLKWIPFTS
jgi:hypothetical protein